jgi:hypothetical protein
MRGWEIGGVQMTDLNSNEVYRLKTSTLLRSSRPVIISVEMT